MRIAYFDCFSGISGDMTLGALVDAGVDGHAIKAAVDGLGLPAELRFATVRKKGFRATHAKVITAHEHAHRHLHHIEAMIEKAALPPKSAELARRIFRKLGEAEAHAHGIPIEKVHFHEVGAVDSIVDIVGAAVGLDLLGVERFESGPVPTGRGWVNGAHGKMPLPAPATAELLKGVPLADLDLPFEMTTPTGAAIVTTVAERFGALPAMTIDRIGLGAGTREVAEQPNLLRLFVGTIGESAESDRVWVLETNLDDLPGEIVGYATTKLMEAGALDAFVTPVYMKKNRPGAMVTVLCGEGSIPSMEEILFRETGTLGIRRHAVSRHKLRRKAATVETAFGPIAGKLGWRDDRPPVFTPEYEDCARVAGGRGVPLREVYQAAQQAYLSAGSSVGAGAGTEGEAARGHDHSHDHGHEHPHEH